MGAFTTCLTNVSSKKKARYILNLNLVLTSKLDYIKYEGHTGDCVEEYLLGFNLTKAEYDCVITGRLGDSLGE